MPAYTARFTLRKTNNLLTVIAVLLGLYVILAPLLPALQYKIKTATQSRPALYSVKRDQPTTSNLPADNTLIIPSIYVTNKILDGTDPGIMMQGLWHRPGTSTPDKGGNTVIAGHRYNFIGDAGTAFYNLDKVKMGDVIQLIWQKKVYDYKVTSMQIVLPTEVSVEAPTDKSMLTLYTCTPLWSATHRLVIRAELQEAAQ